MALLFLLVFLASYLFIINQNVIPSICFCNFTFNSQVMHARSGGAFEVMGLMLGKVDGDTMIVMDSFALPVEGTETRVNAQAAAYEYMTQYIESSKTVGFDYACLIYHFVITLYVILLSVSWVLN